MATAAMATMVGGGGGGGGEQLQLRGRRVNLRITGDRWGHDTFAPLLRWVDPV